MIIERELTIIGNKLHPYYEMSIAVQEKEQPRQSMRNRSSGFNWFFIFMLKTKLRKNRNSNSLFLLDEPASNLHPESQLQMFEAIKELAKDVQVVYSTHSPYLVGIDKIENTYVCSNERKKSGGDLNNNMQCKPFDVAEKDQKYLQKAKPIYDSVLREVLPDIIKEYLQDDRSRKNFQKYMAQEKQKSPQRKNALIVIENFNFNLLKASIL